MITYKEIRPGDTFVRRGAGGLSEVRRILHDGTSELVKRVHETVEQSVDPAAARDHDEPASSRDWAEIHRLAAQLRDLLEQMEEPVRD